MKHCIPIVVTAIVLTACSAPAEVSPEYRAEIEAWRAERLERLTSEDGWLTVVGLHWLGPGHNKFGSGEGFEVQLEGENVPHFAGTLQLTKSGKVGLRAIVEANVRVNGEATTGAMLATDKDDEPDLVEVGDLRFYIIDRNGRQAVRVKDPKAPALTQFKGLEYFPIDPTYRVTARFDQYESPKEVAVPTVVGTPTSMLAPGLLHFTIDGKNVAIEPYLSSPEDDSYFVIFRDRTSGESTYGAGRFLSAAVAGEDGTTVLDFNKAYNPPCAFTAFATCPLPTPQNSVDVAIEAGERFEAAGH